VVIGWICAFFLGMRRGEKSLRSTPVRAEGSAAQTDGDAAGAPRPPVATISPSDLRPAPVGNRPGTTAGGSQQGPVSGAGAGVSPRPPSGEPQWTIELVRFASGEKAVADDRARKLSGQGLGEVWVSERKIGGRTDLSVCVGKYVSSEDAEKALRDLTALGRIKSNRLINVFQYRK
jgi:septal ring-binding cell division protein DamX